MSLSISKTGRLKEIEDLLLSHSEGLSQAELARLLNVNRSTVNRYIPDLPPAIYIDDFDHNLWKIDRHAYLVKVRFNLNEAMAIHLASRLLATRMDRQNPYAASALQKLGLSLERLAPQISEHMKKSAKVMNSNERRLDPVYLQSLEKLTLSWAENRKVHVWHRNEKDQQIKEYDFAPYFIEPYAVGQSTYVFGLREPPGEIRTFKIERIERVDILREKFEIPLSFDPYSMLSDAWGIWFTGEEPEKVELLFHPRAAHRIGETRWHRSEQVELKKDGSLLWSALIAEPREMIPWIRGWGAEVEVVSPSWLRTEIILEIREMMGNYNTNDNE